MGLAQNRASSKATGKRKLTSTDLDSDHTSQVRSRPKKKAAASGQSKNQHNDDQEDRPATHEKRKKNDDLAKEKRERALILRQQKSSLIEKLNKKLNDTCTSKPLPLTSSPDPHTPQRSPVYTSPSFPCTPQRLSSCSPQRSPPHTQQISFSCTSQRSPPHTNTSQRSPPHMNTSQRSPPHTNTSLRSSPRTPQRWASFQRSPPPTAVSPRSPSPPVQKNTSATSRSPISHTRKSLIFSHGHAQHPPALASVNAKGHPTVAGKQPRKHFQHQQNHQQPQHHQQQTQQQQHQQQQQTHQQQQECPNCNELRLKIIELTRELEDARAVVIKNSEDQSQQYARLRPGFYTAEVATKNGMVELVEGTSIYIHKDQLATSHNCGTKGGESIARNLMRVFFTKQELERGSLTSSDSSKYTPLNSVIVEAIIAFAINNSESKRTTITKAMRNSLTSKRCKAKKQKPHMI